MLCVTDPKLGRHLTFLYQSHGQPQVQTRPASTSPIVKISDLKNILVCVCSFMYVYVYHVNG